MTFLNNFANNTVIDSIATGKNEFIETSLFRFEVPESVVIKRVIGEGEIGLDLSREFFELHLYNRTNNELVKSVAIPFSEGYLYVRDGVTDKKLQLGLTFWEGDPLSAEERAETLVEKYLFDVPLGEYNAFVHLFSDELGSYNENRWQIKNISNSRREVILQPTDINDFDEIEYQQFALDSIFSEDFNVLVQRLFQKDSTLEYERLTEDFFDRLIGREDDLITEDNRELVIDALAEIFREVFQKLKEYSAEEVDERRYRIVQDNFEEFLRDAVFDVVSRRVDLFPDGGITFRAE